jgi:hypothetical protein
MKAIRLWIWLFWFALIVAESTWLWFAPRLFPERVGVGLQTAVVVLGGFLILAASMLLGERIRCPGCRLPLLDVRPGHYIHFEDPCTHCGFSWRYDP